MSQAYNTFMDSYFKRLKRPELFNYNADQSFGANMVHGSEEQNPWANRNQDNAKFGNLGGVNNKVVQGPQVFEGGQIDPTLAGRSFTMPTSGSVSQSQDALNTLMGTITRPVGEYLGNATSDWLNPKATLGDISNKLGLAAGGDVNIPDVAGRLSDMGANPLTDFDPTMGKAGDAFAGIGKEMTQGSTDMLKGAIEGGESIATSFDPVSMGLNAIPALGKMFGLKGDVGRGLKAGASVGSAALQGGLNPISDLGAMVSLYKFVRGLF